MKQSIALALVILALGAAPGFFQRKRLTVLREDHRKLVAEAAGLGVSAEPPAASAEPRLTKRQREDMERQAGAVAAEIIGFARELEALRKSGGKPDKAFEERVTEMMVKLMELDASQLKRVIAGLRDSQDISSGTRGNLISFAIMSLASDHPEAAVALFSESSDLLDKSLMGDQVIVAALSNWAELNPNAALDWMRQHADQLPPATGDEMKCGVIGGAAVNDPKLAFKLIGELDVENPMGAIHAIMMSGHDSPGRRDAVLAALREHLGTVQDESERTEIRGKALEVFARTADKEGFDSLTGWMADSAFTPVEKEQFAAGLTYFTTKRDSGRWVEWMAGNLPAESLADPVREIVGEWTQQDYVSAGQWLGTTPDGPARTAAVEAYAEAVAEYEPQIAAQWAMTLPPGPGRDATLRAVYQNWPEGDPEGAAAFAREHGLE